MNDTELFEARLTNIRHGKSKFLLRPAYQKKALLQAKKIAQEIAHKPGVVSVWIGGSCISAELGKYKHKWNERNYSDIDLFVLLNSSLRTVSSKKSLRKLGLIKTLHKITLNGAEVRFYRISVATSKGTPLKLLDRFSVDVWLLSPSSFRKDIKKFPQLLDNTISFQKNT